MKIKAISIFLILIFLNVSNSLLISSVQTSPKTPSYREKMVRDQIVRRGITDKSVLNAFLNVEREHFTNQKYAEEAYKDVELSIGESQFISRPYITAIMVSAFTGNRFKKILDVGTGSGYQAAILSELDKSVYSMEIKPTLLDKAKLNLKTAGYQDIRFKAGDAYHGWEQHAPYDGIIVTFSLDHIPPKLIDQLSVGGRLMIPVKFSDNVQELVLIEKVAPDRIKKVNLIPVQFISIIRPDSEED